MRQVLIIDSPPLYSGYLKDKLNTEKIKVVFAEIKKDANAPICSISLSGTAGDNSYYKSNVTVTMTQAQMELWNSKWKENNSISITSFTDTENEE